MEVEIIGYGWVGKAMHKLFPDATIHDPALGYTRNAHRPVHKILPDATIDDTIRWRAQHAHKPDVAFVCVPTPNIDGGALDGSIVEKAVQETNADFIIIRSTVMPGTTDRLASKYDREIVFQPEYLGETVAHPLLDQGARPFMVLGGTRTGRMSAIELYHSCYNANIDIRQMDAYTAEVVKLTENRAIAFKVAQCQELYDACKKAGVDYYEVVQAVYGADPRFNLWWTFVYPKRRGFNSKCIPKDVYGWAAWAESVGASPALTNKLLAVNKAYIGRGDA